MTAIAESPTGVLDIPQISFVRPLPGLGEARRFALMGIDDAGVLYSLQCLDSPDIRLVVAAPAAFFPDYSPEIDEQAVCDLGLSTAEDALLLVVLTVADSLQASTANLLAPIVIHRDTRAAAQVVLANSDLPLRAPLAA